MNTKEYRVRQMQKQKYVSAFYGRKYIELLTFLFISGYSSFLAFQYSYGFHDYQYKYVYNTENRKGVRFSPRRAQGKGRQSKPSVISLLILF